jgi:hypothetical protein
MVDNGTEQALVAEAQTITPKAQQGPDESASAAGLRELKCCPP